MSEKKKVISVMIPTYNEEENARPIYEAVRDEIRKDCPDYDYEILFIDNKSQDRTRRIITDICAQDPKVKAIFNSKNFGQFNSPYYRQDFTKLNAFIVTDKRLYNQQASYYI